MRTTFESEFADITGNGWQTEFRIPVTPRTYLAMELCVPGQLDSLPTGEAAIDTTDNAEVVVRFAVAPLPGARYWLVLGWRGRTTE